MNKISWCEVKKSKDGTKEWKELTLEGGQKVSIWPNHPEYLKAAPGATVSGDIVVNGKYTNLAPSNVRTPYSQRPGASQGKSTWTPEKSKEVQDIKDLSFKIAGTQRDAVLCAIAEYNAGKVKDLESVILKWRKWLWENYDAKDTDFAPFPDKPVRTDDNEPPLDSYERDYQAM